MYSIIVADIINDIISDDSDVINGLGFCRPNMYFTLSLPSVLWDSEYDCILGSVKLKF